MKSLRTLTQPLIAKKENNKPWFIYILGVRCALHCVFFCIRDDDDGDDVGCENAGKKNGFALFQT